MPNSSEPLKLKTLGNIHHVAYRCRDAEQTRWFYEDVLGFPLKMGLISDTDPVSKRAYEYMHLFFEMGDGNFIAFFDAPDDAENMMFWPASGYDRHIAFECESREELEQWRKHINALGVPCGPPVDHEFVESIYMYDPNGLQVEITMETAAYEPILSQESKQVHAMLKQWTARTRDKKLAKFGAQRLDRRAEACQRNIAKAFKNMLAVGEKS